MGEKTGYAGQDQNACGDGEAQKTPSGRLRNHREVEPPDRVTALDMSVAMAELAADDKDPAASCPFREVRLRPGHAIGGEDLFLDGARIVPDVPDPGERNDPVVVGNVVTESMAGDLPDLFQ